MNEPESYPWLWDVDMDAGTFQRVLQGQESVNGRDWRWALVRLLEYAPYADICKLLPVDRFLTHWPALARRIRSDTRREGMDYVYTTLLKRKQAA